MSRSRPPYRSAAGFTLIELAACLVLMGLVTGLAALSLRSREQLARMEDLTAQLQRQDELLRTHARRSGQAMTLVVDLGTQTLQRAPLEGSTQPPAAWAMPAGFTIEQVWSQHERARHGKIALPCSADGWTPTYALALRGPDERRTWWLTTGMTGQPATMDHDHQVQEAFDALAARPDAD